MRGQGRGPFYTATAEIRVDWSDILSVNEALTSAQTSGASADTITQLQLYETEFHNAFMNSEGLTKPLSLCSSSSIRNPEANNNTKPTLLLVDEMSASAADFFAAMVQDDIGAPLFGYRTMGAGGSPEQDYAGVYTGGATFVTRSLAVRPYYVSTADYPPTRYIENVGVWPDIVLDYMTTDDLVRQGAAFVDAFTTKVVNLVHGM
jgi:hypothetical protein